MSNTPTFNLADAKISVFLSSDLDWPDETSMDDPATLAEILARLKAGDVNAWCLLTVRVEWRGFHGRDNLGGVSLAPGGSPIRETSSGPMLEPIATANDHGMLGCAVQDLAANMRKAGWTATFPGSIDRDALLLARGQAVTHDEPGCPACRHISP